MNALAVAFEDIVKAQECIRGAVRHTPVMTSRTANSLANADLYFKCENFQCGGAFKFRGAYNALAQLTPEQKTKGVIAYSSGNHAQAIALAANMMNMRSVVLMPEDAPSMKIAAARGYGAEIIFYNRYKEDRESIVKQLAEAQELTLVPPYDCPKVIAGQGTAAKELFDEVKNLDMLIAPVGGGGLLSGCAIVAKALNPSCLVIGVEPEAGNDAQQSLRNGRIIHIETPKTIADGAQTQHLGNYTFPLLQRYVDEVVTVSDAKLVEAMTFFASRMKMLVEPTGCLAAAAAFSHAVPVRGKKVGIIVSGGNIDIARFSELTSELTKEVAPSHVRRLESCGARGLSL